MKACSSYREKLLLFLDGEVEASEELLFHLETCHCCQGYADDHRRLSELLKRTRSLWRAPESLREKVSHIQRGLPADLNRRDS